MKLTKAQLTPEVQQAIKHARTLGAEAYANGIRRPHDDNAVIETARPFNNAAISTEIFRAWHQGATKAMFAMMNN